MDVLIVVCLVCYLMSTVGYIIYLFLQRDWLQQTAFYFFLGGCCLHTLTIILAGVQAGHFPVRNLYETLSLAAWAVAGVFLVSKYRVDLKILGVFAAPLVTLIMTVATQLPREPQQTNAIFKSFWLFFHVLAVFIGEASFALACGLAILYLLQEHAIKTKHHGFFFKRLPSLDLLDSVGYGCIIVGFTLLSIGLVSGFVYAKAVWGRFWGWDPKEVWSGITWLLYAVLLHERLTVGWRGRRSAILVIIGFGIILFTFLGVNFFFQGHHGEFTRI